MLRAAAVALVVSLLWAANPSFGQTGPLPLGDKALPVWTATSPAAKHSLGEVTRQHQSRVFLVVGVPRPGSMSIGTAWVISPEHRLLATNAHVADALAAGKTFVIQNGSRQTYPVTKAWYHPGVRRYIGTSRMSVRSMDPKDGAVDPRCPDIAVLQLGPEGPDLPPAFTMADPEELKTLYAQPVGMIGYPAHDTKFDPNQRAEATFHEGIVSRITDFQFTTDCPFGERQFIQHTIPDWGGFSGSPIYLPNGHVVALHNMARSEKGSFGDVKVIPHGIRVDALWELLVHHKIDDKVTAKFDRTALDIKRWFGRDERAELFKKVVALTDEADYLVFTKEDFNAGLAKAKEALEINPQYGPAYRVRAFAYNNAWFNNRRQLSHLAAGKLLQSAGAEIDMYAKLQGSQVDVYLDQAVILNNGGAHFENPNLNRQALDILNKVLPLEGLTVSQKAEALSSAGIALDNLDDDQQALRKHNEAVSLRRDAAYLWERLADFHRYNGGGQNFVDSCMARGKALREKRYSSGLYWSDYSEVEGQLRNDDAVGRVRNGAYYKVHTITLEKGILYQIELFSPTLDTYLRIENSDEKGVADDDDTGGQLDSMIFFSPPESGTYRLVATTFEPRQVGSYTLKVQAGKR